MEFAVTAAEEAFCEDIHQFLRDHRGGTLRHWEREDIGRGRRQPSKVVDEHIGIEDPQRRHARSRRSATHLAASCISGRSAHMPNPIGSKVSSAWTCGR